MSKLDGIEDIFMKFVIPTIIIVLVTIFASFAVYTLISNPKSNIDYHEYEGPRPFPPGTMVRIKMDGRKAMVLQYGGYHVGEKVVVRTKGHKTLHLHLVELELWKEKADE